MSNFPIVGDKKYGNKNNKIIKFNKLHLHSHSVDFKGLNGDILHFEAPLPEHMMETWIKYNLPLKPDNDFFPAQYSCLGSMLFHCSLSPNLVDIIYSMAFDCETEQW